MLAIATASADDIIIRLGAVAAALVAIFGLVRMATRFGVKQITHAIRIELGEKVERVYENTMELKPNGGSSLRDAVNRLEVGQLKVEAGLAAQREALVDHLKEHKKLD